MEVDGLVYLQVVDAANASYGIADYRNASVNLAQTTMRSEVGKIDLDTTFSERDLLNTNIVREIDRASDSWGIKVLRYEIKNIEPSMHIVETMEKQMEAERERLESAGVLEAHMTHSLEWKPACLRCLRLIKDLIAKFKASCTEQ